MAETRNVFVSHIHEDETHIDKMKALLSEHGFDVRDASITSETPNAATNPDYIKNQILAPKIHWSSVVVVLISPNMRNSEYVDWEIEYAERSGKRIVGVWTYGGAESELPEALKDYADVVVAWNGKHIKEAICGDRNDSETSGGEPRKPLAIRQHGC